MSFATLVENVRACSTDEKEELKLILERNLVEKRRDEIHADHLRSMRDLKSGKAKFSSSIVELKKKLAEE